MSAYLIVIGSVFALNLMPAFGPPTSVVLVALTLNVDIDPAPLIACGAISAACGRYTLARVTRHFRSRLSAERRAHLAAAEQMLTENKGRTVAGLGLFALSPVPSGQLFVAAGLLQVRLLPLTAAFFSGRLVAYTIYVLGAELAASQFGDAVFDAMRSPLGIAAQLAALVALVMLIRVDWIGVAARRAKRRAGS